MTREEFDHLVHEVEARFAGRPASLRRRVVLWALVGYAGLLAWLGIVLALGGLCFLLAFWSESGARAACLLVGLLVVGGGGYAVLRAMLVPVPVPDCRRVTRAEAPELFGALDGLQRRLKCPPFDQVMIEPVCNAAVVQIPRLGVLGWHRNFLLLGLPLMDGLTREEMLAVIAHECSHLSRQHGRLTHWVYRLRRSWERVIAPLSAPGHERKVFLRPLLVKFINLFWPRFNAHAFVLSRTCEYEADADSASVAGKETAGSALLRLNIVARQLEESLWPGLLKRANEEPVPPGDVFQLFRDAIVEGPNEADGAKWRLESLQKASTNSDTHPCLRERLEALGVGEPVCGLKPPTASAASALLGAAEQSVRADVQSRWAKTVAGGWKDRHARANALKERLGNLGGSGVRDAQYADRLWDRALVLTDLDGGKAAKPLLEELLNLRPDFSPAMLRLGTLLLKESPGEGIILLERCMEQNEEMAPQIYPLLHNHYRGAGDVEKLRALAVRMDTFEKSRSASLAELREVSARDTLLPHGLEDTELAKLREVLAAASPVERGCLAQKELKHSSKQRLFVLCLHPRRPWHRFPDHESDRRLVSQISQRVELSGRLIVFTPAGSFRGLARKLELVPNAEVFRRN